MKGLMIHGLIGYVFLVRKSAVLGPAACHWYLLVRQGRPLDLGDLGEVVQHDPIV